MIEGRAVEAVAVERAAPAAPGWSRWAVLGAAVAVLAVLPLLRDVIGPYHYVLQLVTVTLMWIAMTSSWNIIGGYASYISLGHGVFMGIGGYASGMMLVHWGWSPFWTAALCRTRWRTQSSGWGCGPSPKTRSRRRWPGCPPARTRSWRSP